jgi:hypothetical protein
MRNSVEVTVDVTESVGSGERLRTRATVTLPELDAIGERAVVCFAFPGGGYSRGYFTFDMPGSTGGGQAGWHARRGWVFVSCDHLCVGDSDAPTDPAELSFESLATANAATVEHVWARLVEGTISDGFPALTNAVRLGIGQSLGGCLTIVQQGQHATFDGIGILGFSARHTVLAMPPGAPRQDHYVPRGSKDVLVSATPSLADQPEFFARDDGLPMNTWGFHYDDEPTEIVRSDMVDYPGRLGVEPAWASATMPPCAVTMLSPGVVAPEASVIQVPVFVGVGERDVCPRPMTEPVAYQNATDVSVFICPRMSHMHNFAGTRETLWSRIESWGNWVARSI